MKTLLILLLSCVAVSAQVPSFRSFDTNYFTTNGFIIRPIYTNNLTINPSDNYLPYRSNATTFGDSPLYVTAGTNVWFSTNRIFSTDSRLNMVNSNLISADVGWNFIDGNGATARFMLGSGQARVVASDGADSVSLNTPAHSLVLWDGLNAFYPSDTNVHLGTVSFPWKDGWFQGAVQSSLPGVTNFLVTTSSGYTGAGTLFLSDDGTYKAGSGLGTTINPTDNRIPYRQNSTTFGNSPWYRVSDDTVSLNSITNYLVRSGSGIVYSNVAAATSFQVSNGSDTAYMGIASGQAYFQGDGSGDSFQPTFGFGNQDGYYHAANIHIWEEDGNQMMRLYWNQSPFTSAGSLNLGAGALYFGTSATVLSNSISSGSGSAEGVLGTTGIGSLYIDRVNARLELKQATTGSTNWVQVHNGNQAYLAANATVADATLVNLSMSAAVINAKKYSFVLTLFCANSTPADGVKIDFDGGSATATNFRAHAIVHDTAFAGSSQVSALATDITVATITGDSEMVVKGSFEPSASGTFIPRFAEVVDGGGTLTVYRGSNLILTEIP